MVSLVWWDSLSWRTNNGLVQRLQKSADIVTSGTMPTTPISALAAILYFPPFEIYCKCRAAKSEKRRCSTRHWKGPVFGHSRVLDDFGTFERIYYMVPRYNLTMNFAALMPERVVWRNDAVDLMGDLYRRL